MNFILTEFQDYCFTITLNRVDKQNAFDDRLLQELDKALELAYASSKLRAIVIKANGKNFCAGADLTWMQKMADYSLEENFEDAKIFAQILYKLYSSPVPIIGIVQGCAFGGGVGLIAICDIVIAADNAKFCFSEVKLGLIPAVISPYVIDAIGVRQARALFISAEIFDVNKALAMNLVHRVHSLDELHIKSHNYIQNIVSMAPNSVKKAKALVKDISQMSIDKELITYTANLIAQQRNSAEGKYGIKAFLQKTTPIWDDIWE